MVGYATVYTAAPVLSLVLDKDVDEDLANLYPNFTKNSLQAPLYLIAHSSSGYSCQSTKVA